MSSYPEFFVGGLLDTGQLTLAAGLTGILGLSSALFGFQSLDPEHGQRPFSLFALGSALMLLPYRESYATFVCVAIVTIGYWLITSNRKLQLKSHLLTMAPMGIILGRNIFYQCNTLYLSALLLGSAVVLHTVKNFLAQRPTDDGVKDLQPCLLYTSPSPRDLSTSRMPSSA